MRIVIVDDEAFIRLGLEKIMSKMDLGVEVIASCSSAAEGLATLSKLGESEIDLLITDIKMPIMDGLKLIERVRERFKQLNIVVLSGFSEFDYARTALRHGVRDYLLKPIDKTVLYELLSRMKQEKRELSEATVLAGAGVSGAAPDADQHYVIDSVKAMLEKEYDKNFELERLAEHVGMSGAYLSRLFREKANMTLTDYLIQLRIEKAKQFLIDHPHLKNYEIAQLVGYSDPVYFNKLFKKIVGVTPKDYKERHRG
ncbi:YesN/AraC family two-component response regulator [Paenibacillus phyllosphaerae]|uniref:YesN/AraC family two-component response regulator n=1 Tax=Paenibacillus phyllosphaerae TaxID=274593 RepID=A0A7W5FQ62_9BACL|nr:response regulator [Paenibacillus phyllosphaerae]MBB3112963.1 YesN/AraC family two-component response regulator [Paenibacillus phyllosphaerae]